jgi:hypothetical protein
MENGFKIEYAIKWIVRKAFTLRNMNKVLKKKCNRQILLINDKQALPRKGS